MTEYRGNKQRSVTTGKVEFYFSSQKRNNLRAQSGVIIALLIAVLLAVVRE